MLNKKIVDTVNQMLVFLDNQNPHFTYGIPSSDFEKDFNPEIDYKTQFANWYRKTEFYNHNTYPDKILSEYYPIEPIVTSNTEITFPDIILSLDTTWGYGKYFDGESVELTSKSEETLNNTVKIVNDYLGGKITINDRVSPDRDDTILIDIEISDIELEIQLTREEEMALAKKEFEENSSKTLGLSEKIFDNTTKGQSPSKENIPLV